MKSKFCILLGTFLVLLFANRIRAQAVNTITTVAGMCSSICSDSGSGGSATAARFKTAGAVAVDRSGNLFIADLGNSRILKVNTSGIISNYAGNGIAGFKGDGGPANNAEISIDYNGSIIAVDNSGNLFIADTYNNRIRKVNTKGTISTIAGNGIPGYSGDGKVAWKARLCHPNGVAVDADGNLYILDLDNARVRKISKPGIISTVAGNGLNSCGGDGGPATSASIFYPSSIAVDRPGNIYITDKACQSIRKINKDGIILTVAGNGIPGDIGDGGQATDAELFYPSGLAVDIMGNLYVGTQAYHNVRKINSLGVISTFAGNEKGGFSGDGGPPVLAGLMSPCGIAINSSGDLYISDAGNGNVRKVK